MTTDTTVARTPADPPAAVTVAVKGVDPRIGLPGARPRLHRGVVVG